MPRGPRPEHRPVRRRDPDRRRTADPQRLDRLPDRRHVPAVDLDELGRQPRLVDQPQEARRRIPDPADRLARVGFVLTVIDPARRLDATNEPPAGDDAARPGARLARRSDLRRRCICDSVGVDHSINPPRRRRPRRPRPPRDRSRCRTRRRRPRCSAARSSGRPA